MSSKYLGCIGNFELHAFSESGEYQDSGLAKKMHEIRYRVLEKGHPIYCTAVSPDFKKKEERNPHDALPTTTNFVTINRKTKEIEYILSTARDSGETYRGDVIGVPLENRFILNGYPPGVYLDEFRSRFLRENYGIEKDVEPMRIVELYRHVKNKDSRLSGMKAEGARLTVYATAYQHLVRDALQEGRTPSDLWVWDAIPYYADKYAYVNGVFRDLTINRENGSRWVPTRLSNLKLKSVDDVKHYFLKKDGTCMTRNLPILVPPKDGSFGPENRGDVKPVGMIDGLVDVGRVERMIKKHPWLFLGEDKKYRKMERGAMGVVCHRMYKNHHWYNPLIYIKNTSSHIKTGTFPWRLKKESRGNHSLLLDDLHASYEMDL